MKIQIFSIFPSIQIEHMLSVAQEYQKKERTALRKPETHEIGQMIITYVKNGDSVRIESTSTVSATCVIARNLEILGQVNGKDVCNEWPISLATAVKNYGQDVIDALGHEFTLHKKKATVKAIILTPEVMNILGVQGHTLDIPVSWSDKPMQAQIGDYLTTGGYSISAHDMSAYEKI